MTVKTKLLLLALGLAVSGCGTYEWQKPGAGNGDFQRDSQRCQGAPTAPAGDFEKCMNGLGWTLDR